MKYSTFSEIPQTILDKMAPGDYNSLTEQATILKAVNAVDAAGLLNPVIVPTPLPTPTPVPPPAPPAQYPPQVIVDSVNLQRESINAANTYGIQQLGIQSRIACGLEGIAAMLAHQWKLDIYTYLDGGDWNPVNPHDMLSFTANITFWDSTGPHSISMDHNTTLATFVASCVSSGVSDKDTQRKLLTSIRYKMKFLQIDLMAPPAPAISPTIITPTRIRPDAIADAATKIDSSVANTDQIK